MAARKGKYWPESQARSASKRHAQLGMNAGTATNRLLKDLLFHYVGHLPCYRCKGALSREDFSIDHKAVWLDSADPVALFFDIGNVAFSHRGCNSKAARRPTKKYKTVEEGCRIRAKASRIARRLAQHSAPPVPT